MREGAVTYHTKVLVPGTAFLEHTAVERAMDAMSRRFWQEQADRIDREIIGVAAVSVGTTAGKADDLTFEKVFEMARKLPPAAVGVVVRYGLLNILRAEAAKLEAANDDRSVRCRFLGFGMKIYEKHGQVEDALVFYDARVLEDYLAGKINSKGERIS